MSRNEDPVNRRFKIMNDSKDVRSDKKATVSESGDTSLMNKNTLNVGVKADTRRQVTWVSEEDKSISIEDIWSLRSCTVSSRGDHLSSTPGAWSTSTDTSSINVITTSESVGDFFSNDGTSISETNTLSSREQLSSMEAESTSVSKNTRSFRGNTLSGRTEVTNAQNDTEEILSSRKDTSRSIEDTSSTTEETSSSRKDILNTETEATSVNGVTMSVTGYTLSVDTGITNVRDDREKEVASSNVYRNSVFRSRTMMKGHSRRSLDSKLGTGHWIQKYRTRALIACLVLVVIAIVLLATLLSQVVKPHSSNPRYLVNTRKCKVPDIDPRHKSLAMYPLPAEPIVCSTRPPLTLTTRGQDGRHVLRVDTAARGYYAHALRCCYAVIKRVNDLDFSMSACASFDKEATLAIKTEFIMVMCHDKQSAHAPYVNMHAVVTRKQVGGATSKTNNTSKYKHNNTKRNVKRDANTKAEEDTRNITSKDEEIDSDNADLESELESKKKGHGSVASEYGINIDIGSENLVKKGTSTSEDSSIKNITSKEEEVTDNKLDEQNQMKLMIEERGGEKVMHKMDLKAPQRPSLLLLGINSMSRLSLIRTMPLTFKYLQGHGFLEYRGFNKIGIDTPPNLMATFTGRNQSQLDATSCWPKSTNSLDGCPFIWREYKRLAYVTAYAEDTNNDSSSFNTDQSQSFTKKPTDFYLRPFMIAAETLMKPLIRDTGKYPMCLGPTPKIDHVMKYTLDVVRAHPEDPLFIIQWLNHFSYNNFNTSAAVDKKFVQFFEDLSRIGNEVFNNSIVVFFSDHGSSYRELRKTAVGWYEERLPFLHVRVPEWFRAAYPVAHENLKNNVNKLISPYDLHLTLKDIVNGTIGKQGSGCDGCRTCGSLFYPVVTDRSCEEAGIPGKWCTCKAQTQASGVERVVKSAPEMAINKINRLLSDKNVTDSKCAKLRSNSLLNARLKGNATSPGFTDYVIAFDTLPGLMVYETSIRYFRATSKLPAKYQVLGIINRVGSYLNTSKCMELKELKPYCYCS